MATFPYYKKFYKIDTDRLDYLVAHRPKNVSIYKGKYIMIRSKWDENIELNYLTDYFSEECRLTCKFAGSISPIEYWKKNHGDITLALKNKGKAINNFNVREEMYKRNKKMFCNNFRINVCLDILEIFKPEKVLDISAGWGDRLISSLLSPYVTEYCGVDPNPCVHKAYRNIIKTLNPAGKKKCKLIRDGFETAKLPGTKYDLVLSSPPFFNLEKYSDSKHDSLRFNTVDSWFNGFLMPSIKKAIAHLRPGGYLVLYMDNDARYIPRMIRETDRLAENAGQIYYRDSKKIRNFYCWKITK